MGKQMKLWKVHRTDEVGFDEYEYIICAALTPEFALTVKPMDEAKRQSNWTGYSGDDTWVKLAVEQVGYALAGVKSGTVIASMYRAG